MAVSDKDGIIVLGDSATLSNNITIKTPTTPDGSLEFYRGVPGNLGSRLFKFDDADSDFLTKLTAAFSGSNVNLGDAGFLKFPGGVIVQWRITGVSSVSGAVGFTFPITFPNAVKAISITPGTTNQPLHANTETLNNAGGSFSIWGPSARVGGQAARVFAIGH